MSDAKPYKRIKGRVNFELDRVIATVAHYKRDKQFVNLPREYQENPLVIWKMLLNSNTSIFYLDRVWDVKFSSAYYMYAVMQENARGLSELFTNLSNIDHKNKTKEVCLTAIQRNPVAIRKIPDEYLDAEMCINLFKHWRGSRPVLSRYIPEEVKTDDFMREATKLDGWNLENFPEEKKTPGLCQTAVGQNGRVLQFVPEKHRTLDLCLKAIENVDRTDHYNLRRDIVMHTPKEHWGSHKLHKAALIKENYYLSSFPEEACSY